MPATRVSSIGALTDIATATAAHRGKLRGRASSRSTTTAMATPGPMMPRSPTLSEDTRNSVRWFEGQPSTARPDLGIIAQLDMSEPSAAPVSGRSPLGHGGLLRHRVRRQLPGAFLSETRQSLAGYGLRRCPGRQGRCLRRHDGKPRRSSNGHAICAQRERRARHARDAPDRLRRGLVLGN